jgi:hypothetical protein
MRLDNHRLVMCLLLPIGVLAVLVWVLLWFIVSGGLT